MPAQTIIAPPSTAALFLVFTIDETAPEAIDTVRDLFADFPGLNRTVSFRYPDADLYGVIGIGARLWPLITSAPIPEQLHEFREIRGAKHSAPSTPGDLILHLRAASVDMCWELARIVMDRLANVATVVDETHGLNSSTTGIYSGLLTAPKTRKTVTPKTQFISPPRLPRHTSMVHT